MNKKLFICILAAGSIAAVAMTNLNIVSNQKDLSNLTLANVEALAENENGPKPSCFWHAEKLTCPNGRTIDRSVCVSDGDGNSCDCGAVTHSCP